MAGQGRAGQDEDRKLDELQTEIPHSHSASRDERNDDDEASFNFPIHSTSKDSTT